MEALLAALQAEMRAGFSATNRRFDEGRQETRDRHDDNIRRLDRIETEVRATNGRVTRHDEQIRTLFSRLKGAVSKSDYGKREIGIFLAGGASLIAAWRFVEWAVQHLVRP